MTTIKYTGKSDVFSIDVGRETGNALISPGQELELPVSLAKRIVNSSQQFKEVDSSSKKKAEPVNEPTNDNEEKLDG